jgi:hypothetical protein
MVALNTVNLGLVIIKYTVKVKGRFFWIFPFLCPIFNTVSSAAPQIPLCRGDAGIEPRTVATMALAVRHSNDSARSHPLLD